MSDRIKELEKTIVRYQNSYYNGEAEIEDAEFDALWDELKKLDPTNSILTKKVGQDSSDGFPKAKHSQIMGSQNKANSEEDMEDYLRKNGNDQIISWKMDGASLELNYENGIFKQGITRGDGEVGDDITPNVLKMQGLIKDLKEDYTGTIRGEVLVSKANKPLYFADKKNCRAAANGTMKRKDGSGCEHLNIVVYDAQYLDKSKSFGTQTNLQMWLEDKGFEVSKWINYNSISASDCMKYLNDTFSNLDEVPYDIDGLVFKTNKIDMDDITTNLIPETQIALKPARSFATSVIKDIVWDNTNGSFTPVCIIEPTELLGAEITRVNAYNIQFLLNMKIEIGDTISFTRFGEIIPGIARNISKDTVNPRCAEAK